MVSLLEGWGYHVAHRILDNRKQGIPQSRPRFYLVGIQRRARAHQFDFPEDIDPEPIEDFLDDEDRGFERRTMTEAALNVCRRGLEKCSTSVTYSGDLLHRRFQHANVVGIHERSLSMPDGDTM